MDLAIVTRICSPGCENDDFCHCTVSLFLLHAFHTMPYKPEIFLIFKSQFSQGFLPFSEQLWVIVAWCLSYTKHELTIRGKLGKTFLWNFLTQLPWIANSFPVWMDLQKEFPPTAQRLLREQKHILRSTNETRRHFHWLKKTAGGTKQEENRSCSPWIGNAPLWSLMWLETKFHKETDSLLCFALKNYQWEQNRSLSGTVFFLFLVKTWPERWSYSQTWTPTYRHRKWPSISAHSEKAHLFKRCYCIDFPSA